MKTIITIKSGKGDKTSRREYKYTVDEISYIMDKIEWTLKEKSTISLFPLKDGVRMVAE